MVIKYKSIYTKQVQSIIFSEFIFYLHLTVASVAYFQVYPESNRVFMNNAGYTRFLCQQIR